MQQTVGDLRSSDHHRHVEPVNGVRQRQGAHSRKQLIVRGREVIDGATLSREEAHAVFSAALHEDTDPVQFGGLLTALATRRETQDDRQGG